MTEVPSSSYDDRVLFLRQAVEEHAPLCAVCRSALELYNQAQLEAYPTKWQKGIDTIKLAMQVSEVRARLAKLREAVQSSLEPLGPPDADAQTVLSAMKNLLRAALAESEEA